MKKLYLSWQDPISRRWLPVGRLTYHDDLYRFVYTKGAVVSESFTPFGRMKNLNDIYESSELFPLFSNRLLSRSRPDFKRFMNWLDLPDGKHNPFIILALTGGVRKTDSLEIFPCPEPTSDNYYLVEFFSRGLSHLSKESQERVNYLKPGDKLYLMADLQNSIDPIALALRSYEPISIVGYCPRYFAPDFNWLINHNGEKNVAVQVTQVNLDAPFQLKLLCKFTTQWPKNYSPCSSELFIPLPKNLNDEPCKINEN